MEDSTGSKQRKSAEIRLSGREASSGSVGHTAVYGPWGLIVQGPLDPNAEGILYADIDLEDALIPKLRHDVAGSYNRFDVMTVLANRAPHQAVQASDAIDEEETPDTAVYLGARSIRQSSPRS